MDDAMHERLAIRELVENWAVWRDAGDWERFRTVWESQFRPALDAMAAELTNASQEVDRRKVAIDHAAN